MLESGEKCLGNASEIGHYVLKSCDSKNILYVQWRSSLNMVFLL